MPSPEFVDEVLDFVSRVPAGRVVTYGDIAWALGSNAPRAVGRVLALYGHAVAWWRVVPATGLPPQGHARIALPHYHAEGTPLRNERSPDDYRIALSAARLKFDHQIYRKVTREPQR